MKNKKPLWIALIAVDIIITVFLFVVSILMLANVNKTAGERAAMTGFVGWLVNLKPWVYGVAFVVPLFLLLAGNIIGLVIYVRKSTKSEPVQVADLSEAQKEALRQELLRDLQGPAPKEEAKPAEEPKPEAEQPEEKE